MTTEETAWLAGWLEGEGTFYYRCHKIHNWPKVCVQVFSVDRDVIEKGARITGGAIYYIKGRPPSSPGWRLSLESDKAVRVMRVVLPMMGTRRSEQINKALAGWENRPNQVTTHPCECGCGELITAKPHKRFFNQAHAVRGWRRRKKALAQQSAAA